MASPLRAARKRPRLFSELELDDCPTELDALMNQWLRAGKSMETIRLELEESLKRTFDKGQFSCIRSGSKHFPARHVENAKVSGNVFYLQWVARRLGFDLVPADPRRREIERLRRQLDELEAGSGRVLQE